MELTVLQKEAILAVAEKEVKALHAETRREADRLMLEANARDNTKGWEIEVGGMTVAIASVAKKKGHWEVADDAAWLEFAIENGLAKSEVAVDQQKLGEVEDALDAAGLGDALIYRYTPVDGWEKRLADIPAKPILKDTGEVIPGMEWVEGIKYTAVKPKASLDDIRRVMLALGETRPVLELVGGGIDG